MSLVVFDFDNTIINITDLHRKAWELTLNETGLRSPLREMLPKTPFIMERFDSANRVKEYFFKDPKNRQTLEFYFESDDRAYIVQQLLSLKESHLLYFINSLSISQVVDRMASNFLISLDMLQHANHPLGIVSSTRESVICETLRKADLLSAFEFIIGEESQTDGHILRDKPSAFATSQFPKKLQKIEKRIYIGDDARIDSLFALNSNMHFIQASTKDNFTKLLDTIEGLS